MKLFLILAAFYFTPLLHARIGESYEEFEKRVGKAGSANRAPGNVTYQHLLKKGTVTVMVTEGKITGEAYKYISPDDAEGIIKEQTELAFKETKRDDKKIMWVGKNGETAMYSFQAKSLFILDKPPQKD